MTHSVARRGKDGIARCSATSQKRPSFRVVLPSKYDDLHILKPYPIASSGKMSSGIDWKQTGRSQRRIESVPTEVAPKFVEAGYGPPWTIASLTSTPVGKPLARIRPAFRSRIGRNNAARA